MSNTINVSGRTSYYNSFIQSVKKKSTSTKASTVGAQGEVTTKKSDFMSDIKSNVRASSTNELQKTEYTEAVSTKEMTLEEYKQNIFEQISGFRINPSRSNDQYSINISDAGFEAMKNDPEYEEWVLDYIKRDMAVAAPGWYTSMGGPSAYCVLNFGATKEERTGMMISAEYNKGQGKSIFESHSNNSFWTNRADKMKKITEQSQKKAYEKKQHEKALAEDDMKKKLQQEQLLQDYLSSQCFSNQQSVQSGVTIKPSTSFPAAVDSYEANSLME